MSRKWFNPTAYGTLGLRLLALSSQGDAALKLTMPTAAYALIQGLKTKR
jgi:hypothetical protein